MRRSYATRRTLRNLLHTALLFGGMLGLLAALGLALGGFQGALWALVFAIPFLFLGHHLSPQLVLRMYGARPIAPDNASVLYRIVGTLSERAGLPKAPALYYVPSAVINAFSVGRRSNAAIGVTDGILRALDQREISGVLAHEIAHIRDNDMRVMGFADLVSRVTSFLSWLGLILLVLNLPLVLLGAQPVSWWAVALLIVAPVLTGLLQLALSRTREYQADLDGARLTGDPEGLASALVKMDQVQEHVLKGLLLPGYRTPDPSLFRTHPNTKTRVQRLMELEDLPHPKIPGDDADESHMPENTEPPKHGPHWHITGLWH